MHIFSPFFSFSVLPSLEDVLYHEGKVRCVYVSVCVLVVQNVGRGGGMGVACMRVCARVELTCHCSVCFTHSLSFSSCWFPVFCCPASFLFPPFPLRQVSQPAIPFFFFHISKFWRTGAIKFHLSSYFSGKLSWVCPSAMDFFGCNRISILLMLTS